MVKLLKVLCKIPNKTINGTLYSQRLIFVAACSYLSFTVANFIMFHLKANFFIYFIYL